MKTAAIKTVSCAATYLARKKGSYISEAITISASYAAELPSWGGVGGLGGRRRQGREMPKGSGTGTKKKPPTTRNPTLSNAERRKDKSLGSGQHNGKQDLSLLVARRPCQREPGSRRLQGPCNPLCQHQEHDSCLQHLPDSATRATDGTSYGEMRLRMPSPCIGKENVSSIPVLFLAKEKSVKYPRQATLG